MPLNYRTSLNYTFIVITKKRKLGTTIFFFFLNVTCSSRNFEFYGKNEGVLFDYIYFLIFVNYEIIKELIILVHNST